MVTTLTASEARAGIYRLIDKEAMAEPLTKSKRTLKW